jgi:hypothetical protein
MFKKMKEDRSLSNRALAKEIEVSEGTIRNSLLYAEASEVRNDYAFENLSVKQIRYAGMLPERVRNLWLDSGADIPALFNAIAPKGAKRLVSKRKKDIESWLDDYGPQQWDEGSTAEEAFFSLYHFLIEDGLFQTYLSNWSIGSSDRFITVFQKAVKWFEFEKKHFPEWGSHWKIYRDLRTQWRKYIISFFNVGWRNDNAAFKDMNNILAMIFDASNELAFLITPDEFEKICEDRKFKNTDDLKKIVKIAVYEKHGKLLEEDSQYNPESFTEILQRIEIRENAPDYIKNSPLVTHLRYALWKSKGPDWAKEQLASKSYISFNPQQDINELVQKNEFKETNKAEFAKRIAELLHGSNEKELKVLGDKLTSLRKDELLAIYEALKHCVQFGLIKKRLSVLAEVEGK